MSEKRVFKSFFEDVVKTLVRNEKRIYLSLVFIAFLLWISFTLDILNLKKLFAFIVFVVIGGGFKYFISRFRIFVEFTPILFFSVLIAHYIGWFWVVPYLFLADMVPAFLGHHGPTGGSIPYWVWMFIFSIMMIPFEVTNIFARILIPVLYFLSGLFIEQFVKGGLNAWRWTSSVANLAINFYFFIQLAGFFVMMIS